MKKYAVFALALVLAVSLLTACGCSNSQPGNTKPSTLPPTTGATLMPTTEATTMPTTASTTAPATEASTSTDTTGNTGNDASGNGENGNSGNDAADTEQPTNGTANDQARNRMPMSNGK